MRWVQIEIQFNKYFMQKELLPELTLDKQASNNPKTSYENIQKTKQNLDSLIQELNVKLHDHFHRKQGELIQQYKQELIDAQKELNQLKSNTNEEQIKNKMIERKKQLQKQRHDLIETNMFFSNKCEDYKKKLAVLVSEGKELEKELLFLDAQINGAHKKKYEVLAENDKKNQPEALPAINPKVITNTLPLFTDRKGGDSSSKKLVNSVSVRDTNKKAILQQSLATRAKKNLLHQNTQLSKMPIKQFQKTALEELFQTTVQQIRAKRKSKKAIPNLKGQQFTDYEKRQIMQQFLSKQDVKRKIYSIIFQSQQKKPSLLGAFQPQNTKVKISFEDIN